MKKVTVIANPFSGTSTKSNLESSLSKINNDFFDLKVLMTEYAGHGAELAKEELMNGTEIIAAAGGDGTVNEIASVVAGTDKTLAILPGGSGNGFAMHLGLGRDTLKAFEILKEQKTKWVDTCMLNDRFFINIAGLGFDARIAYLTKANKKRGFFQYFKTTIQESGKFKAMPLKITLDNSEVIEGKFAAAVVANASMYGYNFTIAPTAALDDGLFDVMLIKEAPVYKYFFTAYRMLNKTMHLSPLTLNYKATEVLIESEKEDYFHIDGEGFVMDENLKFTMKRDNIKVICK